MSNTKLYESMLNCDGTNKNCANCAFKHMPLCRNAMARHAGALIQLQDVVIENANDQAGLLLEERNRFEEFYGEAMELVKKQRERIAQILAGLAELKHCDSCAYAESIEDNPELEAAREELCRKCQEEKSQWELAAKFGVPEPEKNDVLQPVEDEEEPDPEEE